MIAVEARLDPTNPEHLRRAHPRGNHDEPHWHSVLAAPYTEISDRW
jgi:hypothetical protein